MDADVATTMPSASGPPQVLYKILVDFDKGLEPTRGKTITFKHNMKGKAGVITEDVWFIERIFNEFRDVADIEYSLTQVPSK